MQSTNHTAIYFILDKSGSMRSLAEAAVAGFNSFLMEQQEGEGNARITLALFNHEYELPIDNLPIEEVIELSLLGYQPRGRTALLDAIGLTIRHARTEIKALPKKARPGQVIFAIFTDGLENSSHRYSLEKISKQIHKRREKDGWEFLFLAAGQDAIATAAKMGIDRRSSANIMHSAPGMQSFSNSASRKVHALRHHQRTGEKSPDYEAPIDEIVREEDKGVAEDESGK